MHHFRRHDFHDGDPELDLDSDFDRDFDRDLDSGFDWGLSLPGPPPLARAEH